MVDTVYGPARGFCDKVLSKFGVEITYYDPLIGAGIAELIRPQHADRLYGSAGLAHLRDAGHPRDRRAPRIRPARWR